MVALTNRIRALKFGAIAMVSVALTAGAAGNTPSDQIESDSPVNQSAKSNPAIWSVSDSDTTIYLFGYPAALKPGIEWQSEAFRKAFAQADVLVLEANAADPEAQAAQQRLIPQLGLQSGDETLSQALAPAQREEVASITASLGVPLAALDTLKPWLASVQIGQLHLMRSGYDLPNSPAMQIASMAESANHEIRVLEPPTALLERIAGFSQEEQIGLLLQTVRQVRDEPDMAERLNDAWLSGDVERIGQLLHEDLKSWPSPAVYEAMLVSRNELWADEIEELLGREEGTLFVAVGFGHLAGADSLTLMLMEQGHNVVRE